MDTPGPVGDHIWRAVQELETGRDLPGVLWSHDATGSVGLIEAVQQVFLRMGVGVEPADGMLQVKREELVAEIAANTQETQAQVDMISGVLESLHGELERLTKQDTITLPQVGQDVSLQQQGRIDTKDLEEVWQAYCDDQQTVPLVKLQEMMLYCCMKRASGEQIADTQAKPRSCTGDMFDFNDFAELVQMQGGLLEEVFEIFDQDGDGYISATELRDVMRNLGHPLSDAEVDEMMREGNMDYGKIEFKAFETMMCRGVTGSHGLEGTLKLVQEMHHTTGQEAPKHRALPGLVAATKAVSAASWFCDFALAADSADLVRASTTDVARLNTRRSIKLHSTCAGTRLFAHVVAQLILSERSEPRPAISFALPGPVSRTQDQRNVDDTISAMRQKLAEWIETSKEELRRRSAVRISAECGEVALSERRAKEALANFQRALQFANDDEQTQLATCIQRSTDEKERQEMIQRLHQEANEALAKSDGARTAISRYDEALRYEVEERFPEHKSLKVMHTLADRWLEGDDCLTVWDGAAALPKYQAALQHARDVERIIPTEGYISLPGWKSTGSRIVLHPPAEQQLQECIVRAQQEIQRKNSFNETIRDAETELMARRAVEALSTFQAAGKLHKNQKESENFRDGVIRAEEEITRQREAKQAFEEALSILARCKPPTGLVWTPAEWEQEAEGADIAIEKCTESLNKLESNDGRLTSQQDKQEHRAVAHTRIASDKWKEGDECMCKWLGEQALAAFQAAQKSMGDAALAGATRGYFVSDSEARLQEEKMAALALCIESAKEEVGRKKGAASTSEQAKAAGAVGKAEEAVGMWRKLLTKALSTGNPVEIQMAEEKLAEQTEELARQKKVYELHQTGLRNLKANNPEAALACYKEALTIEKPLEPDAELTRTSTSRVIAHRTEPESLQHMQDICEAWIQANASLFSYDGKTAQQAFRSCQASADAAEKIQRTDGFAGAKIQLRAGADLTLKQSLLRADVELKRNDDFERLIASGKKSLQAWKAEEAEEAFVKAGQLAAERLEYASVQTKIKRPENPKELSTTEECMANATKELRRQKKVKDAARKSVEALESNNICLAFKRTQAGATTTAREHCQEALDHATKSEGLTSQKDITTEFQALELLAAVCEDWKRGDDKLAAWDGHAAMNAYVDAEAKVEKIEQLQPTPGYTSDQIHLNDGAVRELRTCKQEAIAEIERKENFIAHIDNCRTHLRGWRAEQALKEANIALETQKTASATTGDLPDESRNGLAEEETSAAQHVENATAEHQRQRELKRSFTKTCEGLDEENYNTACTRWTGKATPIDHCKSALKLALRTEWKVVRRNEDGDEEESNEEVKLQSQDGTLEHQALCTMLELCMEWKKGDEAIRIWDGTTALKFYECCNTAMMRCGNLGSTEGYHGPKIEPSNSTQIALNNRIHRAKREIQRRCEFDMINTNGRRVA